MIQNSCDNQRTNRKEGSNHAKNKKKYIVQFALSPECIKAPKDKIDGTQRPTNNAVCLSPLNHKNIDNKKESPDAINIVILLVRIIFFIISFSPSSLFVQFYEYNSLI